MARKIARINGIALDVVISETPDFQSEVTAYPVENGGDISDHVHNQPVGVTIEALVSGLPIDVADERGDDPITQVRAALEELRAKRQPFTYDGLRFSYASMVFESLSFPFDPSSGNSLRISATMRRVNTVELVRVASRLRPSPKTAGPPIWLCPKLATTGLFLGIAGAKDVKPGSNAAANQRAGCRRVVRRNGVWVFADNGQRLTLAEINETNRQNNHANIIAVTGSSIINKETIQVSVPISSLPTYNPGAPALQKLAAPVIPEPPKKSTPFWEASAFPADALTLAPGAGGGR